jgi:hypothetical protein
VLQDHLPRSQLEAASWIPGHLPCHHLPCHSFGGSAAEAGIAL